MMVYIFDTGTCYNFKTFHFEVLWMLFIHISYRLLLVVCCVLFFTSDNCEHSVLLEQSDVDNFIYFEFVIYCVTK